ncbi:MAG: hypothetical protein ABUL42_03795 [Terricaulis silvestris]
MRRFLASLLLAFCFNATAVTHASAQTAPRQTWFVGELQKLTLTPLQIPHQRPNAHSVPAFDNSCGSLAASFRIIRSTTRLPRVITIHQVLGEWCDQAFYVSYIWWLVVLDTDSHEILRAYPISPDMSVETVDEPGRFNSLSPEIRQMLGTQALPPPGRITHEPDPTVRNIPLNAIFPGLTTHDFYGGPEQPPGAQ